MTDLASRIADAITPMLAAGGIPGAVAMVGNRDGTLAEVAVGSKGPGGPPLTTDTLFQLASMTKAVTSVAAMQLVEQGRLDLDSDIGTLLPALAAPDVLTGFDDNGAALLRAASAPITLRQLLTHTSGHGYEFMSAELTQWRTANPAAPGTLASITAPLLADPGTVWNYGVGTDWVGQAVEAVAGVTLGDWMAANLFGTLGITDTGFGFDDGVKARLAPLHARMPDGNLVPFPIHMGGGDGAEFHAGGAGLTGSGADYMRFLRMLLRGGELDGARVLRADTVAQMTQNQVGDLPAGILKTNLPGFSADFDFFPGMRCGWGLGFLINPEPGPDGRAAGSCAWDGIANTWFWFDPAQDIAALILMQHLPFAEPQAVDVVRAFERAVYGRT